MDCEVVWSSPLDKAVLSVGRKLIVLCGSEQSKCEMRSNLFLSHMNLSDVRIIRTPKGCDFK